MSRASALVAVILVILEAATAVVVAIATSGSSPWPWIVLGLVVAVTCGLVWWQSRRPTSAQPTTRARVRAFMGGSVEDSPIDVPGRGGDVDVSTRASWWGKIRRSGTSTRR